MRPVIPAKETLQVDELTVVADTGYQNGKQVEHCEAAGITPVVPTQKVVNPNGKGLFTREGHAKSQAGSHRTKRPKPPMPRADSASPAT